MKKGYWKGFLTGTLMGVLILGLGITAMAATRTISVEDSVGITINGARFQPKDANGNAVPLFSYNGTTYAPVRAICEAAGLKVDFDSANYTAVLTTPDRYIASTPSASNYISVDKAKEIALNHAGVKQDAVYDMEVELDEEDQAELESQLEEAQKSAEDAQLKADALLALYTLQQQYSAGDYDACRRTLQNMAEQGLQDYLPTDSVSSVTSPAQRFEQLNEAVLNH